MLRAYFRNVKATLRETGGMFMLDCYGGRSAHTVGETTRELDPAKHKGVCRYTRKVDSWDSTTRMSEWSINFDFEDGSRLEAFRYLWHVRSVAEIGTMLDEAGFRSHRVLYTSTEDSAGQRSPSSPGTTEANATVQRIDLAEITWTLHLGCQSDGISGVMATAGIELELLQSDDADAVLQMADPLGNVTLHSGGAALAVHLLASKKKTGPGTCMPVMPAGVADVVAEVTVLAGEYQSVISGTEWHLELPIGLSVGGERAAFIDAATSLPSHVFMHPTHTDA